MDFTELLSFASTQQKETETKRPVTKKSTASTKVERPKRADPEKVKAILEKIEQEKKKAEEVKAKAKAKAEKVKKEEETGVVDKDADILEAGITLFRDRCSRTAHKLPANAKRTITPLKPKPFTPISNKSSSHTTPKSSSEKSSSSKNTSTRGDSSTTSSDKSSSSKKHSSDKHSSRTSSSLSKHSNSSSSSSTKHSQSKHSPGPSISSSKIVSSKSSSSTISAPLKKTLIAQALEKKREKQRLEEEKEKKEKEKKIEEKKKAAKMKKKLAAPPPLSFSDLINLAKQKQQGPADPKADKIKKPKNEPETGRLMTQDEKDRLARTKTPEYKHWLKCGGPRPKLDSDSSDDSSPERSTSSTGRTSSIVRPDSRVKPPTARIDSHVNSPASRPSNLDKSLMKSKSSVGDSERRISNKGLSHAGKMPSSINGRGLDQRQPVINRPAEASHNKKFSEREKSEKLRREREKMQKSNNIGKSASPMAETRSLQGKQQFSNNPSKSKSNNCDRKSSGQNVTSGSTDNRNKVNKSDATRNKVPPAKTKDAARNNAPPSKTRAPPAPQMSTWDRIYGDVQKNHPKPEKKKRVIESEEESDWDDDLSDFIDDGDIEDNGVSKYIQEIFGYDKNKYRNERYDDVDDMETGYGQMMKEERISGRIGLQEDLEDIRKEEEEKKRKLLKKKKKMKIR